MSIYFRDKRRGSTSLTSVTLPSDIGPGILQALSGGSNHHCSLLKESQATAASYVSLKPNIDGACIVVITFNSFRDPVDCYESC